jgi:3-hydroxyacyl-[acyl-carrier-protein] dehydratase
MYNDILDYLPYKSSFRFVDNISYLDMDGVTGDYTLKKDSFFYEDHFAGNPVTPGVIITEIMVQTGLVVLGIYLLLHAAEDVNINVDDPLFPLLTSSEVSFYKMVLPGQKVTVISKKKYFRFSKLKCYVEMLDETNELIATGTFSGIIKKAFIKNKQI